MKQSNTSRYAYLAGIVDGEGCLRIDIAKEGERKVPSYRLRLQIAQTNGKIIDWLFGNFGGSIYQPSAKKTKRIRPNGEIYETVTTDFRWSVQKREKIMPILKKILPFSIEKKPQIQVGLEFLNFVIQYDKSMIHKGSHRFHRTENIGMYIEKCNAYYNKLIELKKEFVPCAAVETKLVETSKEVKL